MDCPGKFGFSSGGSGIANYSHQGCPWLTWVLLVLYAILYSLAIKDGGKMIYQNMPMMIFILAAGYLFSVYLLLALAKRTGKKDVHQSNSNIIQDNYKRQRGLTANVTEAVNSRWKKPAQGRDRIDEFCLSFPILIPDSVYLVFKTQRHPQNIPVLPWEYSLTTAKQTE